MAALVTATMTLTFVKVELAAHPAGATAIEATAFSPVFNPDSNPVDFRIPSTATVAEYRATTRGAATTHVARLASPVVVAATHSVAAAPRPVVPPAAATGYGCGPALSYLAVHSAPGFAFECPGYALGHQAMTCIYIAGVCPNGKLIAISDPCPAAYMNEASNSWVLEGLRSAPIDPYGYCH